MDKSHGYFDEEHCKHLEWLFFRLLKFSDFDLLSEMSYQLEVLYKQYSFIKFLKKLDSFFWVNPRCHR